MVIDPLRINSDRIDKTTVRESLNVHQVAQAVNPESRVVYGLTDIWAWRGRN
jgi:hypothetical protein